MRNLCPLAFALLLTYTAADAAPITFDEPEALAKFNQSVPSLTVGDLTFTGLDANLWWITPRGTFDNRAPSPYPYDFISGNVLQVAAAALRIDIDGGAAGLGFGAALNATFGLGSMAIELYGANDTLLDTFPLLLDRTVLSQAGGTNSNSEGLFEMNPLVANVIQYAIIRNAGDPNVGESKFNWVIDNIVVEQAAVPEPASVLLLGVGAIGFLARRYRAR